MEHLCIRIVLHEKAGGGMGQAENDEQDDHVDGVVGGE